MTLSNAINPGPAGPQILNPGGRLFAGGFPPVSTTVDRTTTTVDATLRTVDRS
ncbi:MAG TPA: hypothetical protein VL918_04025 [Sphingobium sp.]|nr:hypothetical protein [Sphingobium sp.]